MELNQLIRGVFNEYPLQKIGEGIEDKGLEIKFHSGLNEIFEQSFFGSIFMSKGSVGTGRWAIIPWIGLFDKRISVKASEGFDIVYLFSVEKKEIYLSLNQGWAFYSEKFKGNQAKRNILYVSNFLRNNLHLVSDRMSADDIHLLNDYSKNPSRPKGYEAGNIVSIKYELDSLPPDDALIDDLNAMKSLLLELESLMTRSQGKIDIESSINFFLSQVDRSVPIQDFMTDFKSSNLTKADLTNLKDEQIDIPSSVADIDDDTKSNDSNSSKITKTVEKQNIQNKRNGYLGELFVLEMERKKLRDSSDPKLTNLAKKVTQVSVTEGDGKGYDILSFDLDGNELYIEVKTTKSDHDNAAFYISENELNYSKNHSEGYRLIRLIGFSKNALKRGKIRYFCLKGDVSQVLKLKPSNYIATV
ncbi:DUF3578 domain-containing protein [Oenococcus sicerae]|uniref:DUF3578 domain-containing protein n=1 Tax=Oenococcus sicerae TaxID=2203724 RepID=A0ABX5QNC7_9LACO|nr:DUF3578 domain-containing protein [Oenococcus sicerae]QAS70273.1 DUF3578 domain-containing protein [Oenococcus sicerae]